MDCISAMSNIWTPNLLVPSVFNPYYLDTICFLRLQFYFLLTYPAVNLGAILQS